MSNKSVPAQSIKAGDILYGHKQVKSVYQTASGYWVIIVFYPGGKEFPTFLAYKALDPVLIQE